MLSHTAKGTYRSKTPPGVVPNPNPFIFFYLVFLLVLPQKLAEELVSLVASHCLV